MQCSVNEIYAMAEKAARGGGAPAGQAIRFGRAVAAHLAAQRPESDIEDAILALPNGAILSCPITSVEAGKSLNELEKSYSDPLPNAARLTLSEELFKLLRRYAARTYVPATDASRANAGAGLTDND